MFENKFYLFLFLLCAVFGALFYMPILMIGCGALLFIEGVDNLRLLHHECYKGMPWLKMLSVALFAVIFTTLTSFTGGMALLGVIYILGI